MPRHSLVFPNLSFRVLLAIISLFALVGMSIACRVSLEVVETPTPLTTFTPAQTPTPQATATLAPSSTPAPTATVTPTTTPTPTPTLKLPLLISTPLPTLPAISVENVTHLVELARWGTGRIERIRFSPDGRFLAVVHTQGISIYDMDTLQAITWINLKEFTVKDFAFSPDGKSLAIGIEPGGVRRFSLPDGRLVDILSCESCTFTGNLTYSPDGSILGFQSTDSILFFQASDGAMLFNTKAGYGYNVPSYQFSSDGSDMAVLNEGGVDIYYTKDGTKVRALKHSGSYYQSLAFTPDGKRLAALWQRHGNDGLTDVSLVDLWQLSDGSLLMTYEAEGAMDALAYAPDGETLVTWEVHSKWAQFWRVGDGQSVLRLEDTQFTFSPDGAMLASWSCQKHSFQLWHSADGSQLREMKLMADECPDYATFSPDGATLASVSHDRLLQFWRVSDGSRIEMKTLITIVDYSDGKLPFAFSPSTNIAMFAAVADDGSLELLNSSDGSLHQLIENATAPVIDMAFSPNGPSLVELVGRSLVREKSTSIGSSSSATRYEIVNMSMVRVLNASDGSPRSSFLVDSCNDCSISLSPDGETLAYGQIINKKYEIQLVRTGDSSLIRALPSTFWQICGFTPDSQYLVAAGGGLLSFFYTLDGSVSDDLKASRPWVESSSYPPGTPHNWCFSLAADEYFYFSQNHKWFVKEHTDSKTVMEKNDQGNYRFKRPWQTKISVGRVSTGKTLYTIDDFFGPDYGRYTYHPQIVFSPDGDSITIAMDGAKIRSYRLEDGEMLWAINPIEGLQQLVFSPDGKLLVARDDKVIRIMDASNGSLLATYNTLPRLTDMAFSPDRRFLTTAGEDGIIQVWGVKP